jgi:hypothetical protein
MYGVYFSCYLENASKVNQTNNGAVEMSKGNQTLRKTSIYEEGAGLYDVSVTMLRSGHRNINILYNYKVSDGFLSISPSLGFISFALIVSVSTISPITLYTSPYRLASHLAV